MPSDDRDDERPYTVYRSRPRLLRRHDEGRDGGGAALHALRGEEDEAHARNAPVPAHRRILRRFTPRRVLGYLALVLTGWVLVSLLLFLVSAQVQRQEVSQAARTALDPAGFTLTSPNTILVLGSDARTRTTAEPGATTIGEPSRSDSILLMRIGGGRNATLSIPRDTVVEIPGHGRDKINAAYALGGPALAIRTVESFLGIQVNHLVEVNFANFPALIDALGGITYDGGCVVSRINGGTRNGGYTLRLRRGRHEINGKQALALARTRKNECNPSENDLTRARRQQKILAAIKDKVVSPETFLRLPFVSWAAPKAVRTDMAGPALLGLVGAEVLGGDAHAQVLKPSGGVTLPNGGDALLVDPAEKQREVQRFLQG
jgi:LCP family protein required for cell wall assembly